MGTRKRKSAYLYLENIKRSFYGRKISGQSGSRKGYVQQHPEKGGTYIILYRKHVHHRGTEVASWYRVASEQNARPKVLQLGEPTALVSGSISGTLVSPAAVEWFVACLGLYLRSPV